MESAMAKAWHARLLSFKSAQITILKQQLNGHRMAAKKPGPVNSRSRGANPRHSRVINRENI
jgi:hypothetical protein